MNKMLQPCSCKITRAPDPSSPAHTSAHSFTVFHLFAPEFLLQCLSCYKTLIFPTKRVNSLQKQCNMQFPWVRSKVRVLWCFYGFIQQKYINMQRKLNNKSSKIWTYQLPQTWAVACPQAIFRKHQQFMHVLSLLHMHYSISQITFKIKLKKMWVICKNYCFVMLNKLLLIPKRVCV